MSVRGLLGLGSIASEKQPDFEEKREDFEELLPPSESERSATTILDVVVHRSQISGNPVP